MLEQDTNITARLRATIEEELGSFRQLADVPSTDLEEMAARIFKSIRPYLGAVGEGVPASRAA